MMTVQKIMKAYNSNLNLNDRGNSLAKKNDLDSAVSIRNEEIETKRKFDSILQKEIQKRKH